MKQKNLKTKMYLAQNIRTKLIIIQFKITTNISQIFTGQSNPVISNNTKSTVKFLLIDQEKYKIKKRK